MKNSEKIVNIMWYRNFIFIFFFFTYLILFFIITDNLYKSYYSVEDWSNFCYLMKIFDYKIYLNLQFVIHIWIYIYIFCNIYIFAFIIFLNFRHSSMNNYLVWILLFICILLVLYYTLKIINIIAILKVYSIDEFIEYKGILYDCKQYSIISVVKYSYRLKYFYRLSVINNYVSREQLDLSTFYRSYRSHWFGYYYVDDILNHGWCYENLYLLVLRNGNYDSKIEKWGYF